MNKKLRKMKNAVNGYIKLLVENPETAIANSKFFLEDVEKLQKDIDEYISKTTENFNTWCDKSIEVWESEEVRNPFFYIKRKFVMWKVGNKLDKEAYALSVLATMKKSASIIHMRLNQFDKLITH